MPSLDDVLAQLAEDGRISDDVAAELRDFAADHPVRQQTRQETESLRAENDRLRAAVTKAAFKEAGVKIDPSALRLPDDLDVTDAAKVREWAAAAGIAEPAAADQPDPNLDAELAQHAELAGNAAGAGTASRPATPQEQLLAATDPSKGLTEEQFWAQLEQAGMKA